MSDGNTERLRDRALEPAATSTQDAAAHDGAWTIRLGPGGVPETVLHSGLKLTSFMVLAAATPIDKALALLNQNQLDDDSAVVVLDGDDVLGVWAGFDLATARVRGPLRQVTDAKLIDNAAFVPLISKACRHEQDHVRCTQPLTFAEKPMQMPACPNAAGLTPHRFSW
ncbi:hypothetical protein ACFXDI_43890 [Streptomyces mirabilis]|uniref:hypothetical protein n=1 Tax=Streptomyces mirabilis TaxID=68239 RepID=UPI00367CF466